MTCYALRTDLVEDFHCHLNSIESSIQFTLETESDGQLAFLDVLIAHNSDRSMDTTVYRKPTHTNKYLDLNRDAHSTWVQATLPVGEGGLGIVGSPSLPRLPFGICCWVQGPLDPDPPK